jgi:hypothetical protein
MNVVTNNIYIRRTLMLRVQRSDGTPPYQVKHSGMFMLGGIPTPGDVFNLRVDPKNPKHIETMDGASEAAPPYVPSPSPSPSPGDSTIAEQLGQLDDMHNRGARTDDEFAAAKRRVLHG